MIWNAVDMEVEVEYDDFERAREEAIERGEKVDVLRVMASVDIDEAIEEATAEQLRAALSREEPGYTLEQIDAIRECFAEAVNGRLQVAVALLPRIFDHLAQRQAAEAGLAGCCTARRAA